MITREAGSWADLVTISNETKASPLSDFLCIKLVANIDCNLEIPEGVAETLEFHFNTTNQKLIIDGGTLTQRHMIRNLRTHYQNPVPIFKAQTSYDSGVRMAVRNIDFMHLILDDYLLYCFGSYSAIANDYGLAVSNCRFKGHRSSKMFYGSHENGYILSSCAFDMPSSDDMLICTAGSNLSNRPHNAYFCRFKEAYGGWEIDDSSPCTSFGNMQVSGCIVEGEIVGGEVLTLTNNYTFDSTVQNVIDADLRTTAEAGSTITVNAPKGIWKNDIRSTDSSITSAYQYINGNQSAIPETPVDMINASKLYTDGFDITV